MTPDAEAGQGLRQPRLGRRLGPGQQLVQRDWAAREDDRGGGVIQRPGIQGVRRRDGEQGQT